MCKESGATVHIKEHTCIGIKIKLQTFGSGTSAYVFREVFGITTLKILHSKSAKSGSVQATTIYIRKVDLSILLRIGRKSMWMSCKKCFGILNEG